MSQDHDPYEGVADTYDQTFKLIPSREHVEAYTLRRLLGDLSGLSVLDLASGTGIFTRTLRRWGAARVLGVVPEQRRLDPVEGEQLGAADGQAS